MNFEPKVEKVDTFVFCFCLYGHDTNTYNSRTRLKKLQCPMKPRISVTFKIFQKDRMRLNKVKKIETKKMRRLRIKDFESF